MSNSSASTGFSLGVPLTGAGASRELPHVEETIEMFGRLRRPLLRYLLTFGIRVCDVEEIVQEAFLALFQHLQSGKPRQNLQGWLFRVCHNLALKHLDKGRGAQKAIRSEGDWSNFHADAAPSPEDRLLESQRHEKLQSVLNALSETDRCCICLRAEGLRYREIAEILGMSLGAVAGSLRRSLQRFERAEQE